MRQTGFTLLELLVVLTLIGLAAGMVGPRFIDMADKLRYRNDWQQLQRLVNTLPMQVKLNGQPLALGSKHARLALPEGWQLSAKQPIPYLANGVCLGGTLTVLHNKKVRAQVPLQAPYCQWQGNP